MRFLVSDWVMGDRDLYLRILLLFIFLFFNWSHSEERVRSGNLGHRDCVEMVDFYGSGLFGDILSEA